MKGNCSTCKNCVNKSYCTMQKDMQKAQYVQCDGYKFYTPKSKSIVKQEKKLRKNVVKDDSFFESTFVRFLKKGGGHSLRTGEFIGIQEK